jgi:glutathione S-transferase
MASKLKIWGRINSTNVKKALWTAEELGLSYESIIVGGPHGGTKTPEYLALNPNGNVPTLQDGDFVLWESNAIVRYLAAEYSGAKGSLWPVDPRTRATADQWMDWTNSTFSLQYRHVLHGVLRTSPEQQDWPKINRAIEACNTLMTIPEAALRKQPYLSGSEFGIGDIAFGCFAYAWLGMPIDRVDTPNVKAWYERLQQRPAFQKAVMIPLT